MSQDKKRGLPDFETLLKGIDPGARTTYYNNLLKGLGGAPGLEKQFMDALIEHRTMQETVEFTIAAHKEIPEESRHEDATAAHERDVAMMLHNVANFQARAEALGAELARVQTALEELKGAGVKP